MSGTDFMADRSHASRVFRYIPIDTRGVIFASLALFDFYVQGFRIGEFLAYALTAYLALITTPRLERWLQLSLFVAATGIYFIYGINHTTNFELLKSALGVFIVALTLVLFIVYDIRVSSSMVRLLIWINIVFFVVQLVAYYGTGYLLNYHWWTDIEARLESGSIVRPAGLYYEPAIYSLAIFMMVTMLDPRESRFNITALAAATTMFLSLSLWGMAAAVFIFVRVSIHRPVAGIIGALVAVLLFTVATGAQNIDVIDVSDAIANRLGGLEADDSTFDRYAGLTSLFEQSDAKLIFGFGFGGPQDLYGGNAVGRLISEIGLLGVAAFVVFLLANADRRLDLGLCLLMVLVAAPIVTYGFFSFWLAARLQARPLVRCKGSFSSEVW
jgi:hypothetical protein